MCALTLAACFSSSPVAAQQWIYRSVPQEDASDWLFNDVASSADGARLVAGAANIGDSPIYTSTNYGASWQPTTAPLGDWYWVASSSNGMVLAAVFSPDTGTGGVYTSSDSGANWNLRWSPTIPVSEVAMSADGTKLVAIKGDPYNDPNPFSVYRSSDSGVSWQPVGPPEVTNFLVGVASSANGTHLAVAGVDFGTGVSYIYTSSDSGTSWRLTSAPQNYWVALASSADGSKLVAIGSFPDVIYTSGDYGTTWQLQPAAPQEAWGSVACSADGTRLVAAGYSAHGQIYTSLDSGVTWQSTNNAPQKVQGGGIGWLGVACSADGKRMVAAPLSDTGLYTLDPLPAAAGQVFCDCNLEGIPGATVRLGTNSVTCDENGYYVVSNLEAGIYTATVSATNYTTLVTSVALDGAQPVVTNFTSGLTQYRQHRHRPVPGRIHYQPCQRERHLQLDQGGLPVLYHRHYGHDDGAKIYFLAVARPASGRA